MVDFSVDIQLNAQSAQAVILQLVNRLDDLERQAKETEQAGDRMGRGFAASAQRPINTLGGLEDKLKRLRGELEDVEIGSSAFNSISKEIQKTTQATEQVNRALQENSKQFTSFGEIATGALRRIGELGVQAAVSALQGLGAAALDSVRVFADYEAAMNNVAAITGDTGKGFDQLKEKARELGATTRYSASEAAEAMTYLASSGQETGQILATTSEVLSLAAAGAISLGQAADITVSTMGQFGIAAEDANRVVDALAATASASAVGVMEVGESMKYLGPTAKTLGMSLEEASAIIAVLGNNGLKGGQATAALSTALVRLAAPTDRAIAAMEAMNFQAFDSEGKFKGMQTVIADLNAGMADYSEQQKAAAISAIFGNEAYQELSILLKEGADGFAEMTAAVTDTDKAAEMAAIQNQGLANTWAELQSAMEEAQIVLAESLSPAINAAGEFIAELIIELIGGKQGASGMRDAAEDLATAIKGVDVKALAEDIKTIVGAFVSFINVVGKATTAYINFQRNTPLGWLARGAGALAGEIYGRSTIDASVSDAQFAATRKLYQAQDNAFIRSRGGVAGTIGGGTSVEIPAFADGGIVTSPTMALIGEGGMNEAVVPLPDGRSIPVQFSGAGSSAGDSERVARLIGREVGVQVAQAMQPFYRQGDIGHTSTGAHFDIKRQDRSYFDRTALDQYVSINGNTPLSAGVTLQGGRFGAPRSYGSHNGWDFAFSGQADLTLKNGAQWVGNTPNTGHGDKASFMTPDGKVYEILHGTFHGQAKPVAAIGGGSGSAPSKAAEIAIALKESLGLTEAQAAGIVGNFLREAGADLNPRINEGGRVGLPLGRGGYGLAQWTDSRQEDLVRFAGSKEAAGNLETQLRFVVHELMGAERNALEKLKQAQSPEEAAAVFEKYYERAGVKAIGERQANARNVFNELQGIGGGEVDYAKTLNDAAREAERLAEARANALEKLQEEIETLKGGNQDLGDRLSLIRRETELYQAGMPIMEGTMELLTRESEATRELEKYKASLAEQVAAEMITKEQSQDLEQQYQDALTQSIELTKQMTQAESDLNKARENYESLQRYNEAYKAQTQAMRDRLTEINKSTSATEQQLYQGQLTGFGTQATEDALFAVQAYNEGQAYLAEQMAALNEEFDKGQMAPEAYQERLTQIKTASEELTEALLKQRDAQGLLDESAQRSAEIQAQQKQIIDNATSGFTSFTMSVLSGSESMAQATGKLFQSILSNLANQALSSFFGGLFGNIFGGGGGGIKFFAKGGIIDKPTNAIMGEAGAEAVVPLPDGRSIPVIMNGASGGATNIVVNVNSPQAGTDGRMLGKQISEAIKAEMANQRRVGGILR